MNLQAAAVGKVILNVYLTSITIFVPFNTYARKTMSTITDELNKIFEMYVQTRRECEF